MSIPIEEYREFELDVNKTLIANFVALLIFGIAMIGFVYFTQAIHTFEEEGNRLLGMFALVWLLLGLVRQFRIGLEYKPRAKNYIQRSEPEVKVKK